MSETLPRPSDRRPARSTARRPVLRYDRHGDVIEVDALDDSCGANVVPVEPLFRARSM